MKSDPFAISEDCIWGYISRQIARGSREKNLLKARLQLQPKGYISVPLPKLLTVYPSDRTVCCDEQRIW